MEAYQFESLILMEDNLGDVHVGDGVHADKSRRQWIVCKGMSS